MIGFPDDTAASIRAVLRYAKRLNPTFANFNVVTPYPGTEFFDDVKEQIASFDFRRYNVYTPVLRYEHLTADTLQEWHAKCFIRYYFRWEWFRDHLPILWPSLARLLRTFAPAAFDAAKPSAGFVFREPALPSKPNCSDSPSTPGDVASRRAA